MQISKCLMFVALAAMTFSGCCLKPRAASRFHTATAGNVNGQCNCHTCRSNQSQPVQLAQAPPISQAAFADSASDCGCENAPIVYGSESQNVAPAQPWPIAVETQQVEELSTQPQLETPNELPGKIDTPTVDELKYVEPPEDGSSDDFSSSANPVESLVSDDDEAPGELETSSSDFVAAPKDVQEPLPVGPTVEPLPVIKVEQEVVKVAQRNGIVLQARPVERQNISSSYYESTRSAPVRQVSVKKQGYKTLNGLRSEYKKLPAVEPQRAPEVKAQAVSVVKTIVEPAQPEVSNQPKKMLRLRAFASPDGGSSGMIKADFRKIDDSTENIHYVPNGYDSNESWQYAPDSIDASRQLNYYVPSRPASALPQRSANADDATNSNATLDFDRLQKNLQKSGTVLRATTDLQTIER